MARIYLRETKGIPGYGSDISSCGPRNILIVLYLDSSQIYFEWPEEYSLVLLGYILQRPEEYLGMAGIYLRVARGTPGYCSDISESDPWNSLVLLGYI